MILLVSLFFPLEKKYKKYGKHLNKWAQQTNMNHWTNRRCGQWFRGLEPGYGTVLVMAGFIQGCKSCEVASSSCGETLYGTGWCFLSNFWFSIHFLKCPCPEDTGWKIVLWNAWQWWLMRSEVITNSDKLLYYLIWSWDNQVICKWYALIN